MQKFLRAVRFDETDDRVYARAASPGEWAVSGAFEFAATEPAARMGKIRQAFANGFLGLESFGRTTFVTVSEITDEALAACESALIAHFMAVYGAPDQAAAREEAQREIEFIAELARDHLINTVLTVRRVDDGTGAIREEFRVITPPSGEPQHAKVWKIVADDED